MFSVYTLYKIGNEALTTVLWHVDVYLLGTVMLVFGMGLYELFISNLDTVKALSEDEAPYTSSLFGMFILKV